MSDSNYQPVDRRPVKSRNTRWAEVGTDLLIRLGLSPNAISLLGMVAAIGAGGCLFITSQTDGTSQRLMWLAAALLCQVRLLCNLFDGMVAVKKNIASSKGELYNEVPDRVSDAAVFVGLGYSVTGSVALGFVAAILSVFVAYVRVMAKSIGAPNDFCGPLAKPQRMAIVTILGVYMCVLPNAWRLHHASIAMEEAAIVALFVVVGSAVTAVRRLVRASRFLDQQNTQ